MTLLRSAALVFAISLTIFGYDDSKSPVFVRLDFSEHRISVFVEGENNPDKFIFNGNLIHSIINPVRRIVRIQGTGSIGYKSATFTIDAKSVYFNGRELSPHQHTFVLAPDLSILEGVSPPFEKQLQKQK